MRAPPQNGGRSLLSVRPTTHGNSFGSVSDPPTILQDSTMEKVLRTTRFSDVAQIALDKSDGIIEKLSFKTLFYSFIVIVSVHFSTG